MANEWQESTISTPKKDGEFDKGKVSLSPNIISFTCWRKLKDDIVFEGIYTDAGIIGGGSRTNWRHIANRILTNLCCGGDIVIYLRNKRHFEKGSFYKYEGIGYRAFTKVLTKLKEAGWVDIYPGGRFPDSGELYSHFRATRKLLSLFADMAIDSKNIDHQPSHTVILRDFPTTEHYTDLDGNKKKKKKRGKPLEFDAEEPNTKMTLELVQCYNDHMANHRLSWDAPQAIRALYVEKNNCLPDLNSKFLIATFTGNMKGGGRMYRAVWVNMPKECRPWLQLDGEFLVDVDLVACHIALLYQKIGIDMPEFPYLFSKADPRRQDAKILLLTMINFPRKETGRKRTANQLILDVIWASKLLKGLSGEGYQTRYQELKETIASLEKFHKPIKHFFYSGLGLTLQYEEGNIMRDIMKECLKSGITILPCHDGCLVKLSQVEELEQIFDTMGYRFESEELKRVVDDDYTKIVKETPDMIIVEGQVIADSGNTGNTLGTGLGTKLNSEINSYYVNNTLLHKGDISLPEIKKWFTPSPEKRYKLSNTPEKRRAEIPTILTKKEKAMLDSGHYRWVLEDSSNEVKLVMKGNSHQCRSIDDHNKSLSEPFESQKVSQPIVKKRQLKPPIFGQWNSAVVNNIALLDESEFSIALSKIDTPILG